MIKSIYFADQKENAVFCVQLATLTPPHKSLLYGVSATTRDQLWIPGTPQEALEKVLSKGGYKKLSLKKWQELGTKKLSQHPVALAQGSLSEKIQKLL